MAVRKTGRQGGSALLIAMIVVVMVAGLATAFLSLTLVQSKTTSNASEGELALQIADAGIDAAILEMNAGVDYGADEIGNASGAVSDGTYVVAIDPAFAGPGEYTIRSTGRHGAEQRTIEVLVALDSTGNLFTVGLFGGIDLTGSGNVFTDGYDSAQGSYASQAVHVDPGSGRTYANETGNIGSNEDITLNGSVTIFGDATPGTDDTVNLSGGAYVSGSTDPATALQSYPPPVYDPPMASLGGLSLSGGSATLTTGTYRYSSLSTSGSAVLTFSGDVVLYVDGNFSMAGTSQIVVAPDSNVEIHHGSGTFKVAGTGLVNQTQLPENFVVYSSSVDTVTLGGTSDFHGAIYAPYALIKPAGTAEFFGSFIANRIQITGGATFHYDENLSDFGGTPLYRIQTWQEILPEAEVLTAN